MDHALVSLCTTTTCLVTGGCEQGCTFAQIFSLHTKILFYLKILAGLEEQPLSCSLNIDNSLDWHVEDTKDIARSLYLPRFYLPKLSELFSVVSKREERESCSLRGYCTSVQLNAYTVTHLWLVYYNSKPKLRNVLNLWIMQYFNIRIIFSEHPVACKYFCTPCSRSLYFGKFYIILMLHRDIRVW